MASAYMASARTSHRLCLLVIIDRPMKTQCMHLSSELLEETQSLFAKGDNVGQVLQISYARDLVLGRRCTQH